MATRMQQRRGTAAQWISTNNGDGPILEVGEIGFETDTGKFKMGDGVNHWIDLDYFLDESEIDSITGDYVLSSTLAQNNGVATLDNSGKLTSTQIPTSLATTDYVDTAVSNLVDSAPGALNTLNELAAAINDDSSYASTITTALGNKLDSSTAASTYAPIASPTFTGTVSGVTKSMVGLGNVDNTSDADKPVSTATQTALDDKAPLASPTFTGTVTLPNSTVTNSMLSGSIENNKLSNSSITINGSAVSLGGSTTIDALPSQTSQSGKYLTTDGSSASWATIDLSSKQDVVSGVSSTEIGYLDGVTSGIQSQLDDKAPLASPTFTGTPIAPTANAGTNNTQVATTAYVDTAVANLVDSAPGALDTLNELAAAINDDASYASTITTALGNKQDKVSGVSDTEIGYLDGVTSAIQTQIDTKSPLASPTFTGTVTLPNNTVTNAMLAGSIANNKLANSSITINGSAVSLGGSTTIDALPSQISNSGKYLKTDGTSASWETISFPYVPIPTTSVSSNINLSSNNRYFVDTSAARTLTLPASPTAGDEIQIFDTVGSAATNVITIASNSNKINGTVQNLEVDIAYDVLVLIYTGSGYGWVVI